jgi:hypothetical protein
MFKLEFMVDDNKLAKVLTAISGLVYEMKPPMPVVNAKKENRRLVEEGRPMTGPEYVFQAVSAIHATGSERVTRKELVAHAADLALSKSAVEQAIVHAMANGLLKKTHTRGVYTINASQLRS